MHNSRWSHGVSPGLRRGGGSDTSAHYRYLLRLADNALVLGHRLTEWSSRAPTLEEDIALSNIALDLIGQARALYGHACALAGDGRDEDQLAFLRDAHEFLNVQLVERPNGDFADTMARQHCYSAFAVLLWEELTRSRDTELAGIAAKAEKECAYHLRHSSEWVIRLGDGTAESHQRMQRAIDDIWMFTGELFEVDEVDRAMIAAGIAADASKLLPALERNRRHGAGRGHADAPVRRLDDLRRPPRQPHRAPGPHAGADAVRQARLSGSDLVTTAAASPDTTRADARFEQGACRNVPSPLVGEGQGGGDCRTSKVGSPPTPNPSPRRVGDAPSARWGGESGRVCGSDR